MPSLESIGGILVANIINNMNNNDLSKTKEAYAAPETMTVYICPMKNMLNNISNPGGTVPPLDPDEG